MKTDFPYFYLLGLIRHDQKSKIFQSASIIKIYYSRLTPIISHLLIVNTMLPTR